MMSEGRGNDKREVATVRTKSRCCDGTGWDGERAAAHHFAVIAFGDVVGELAVDDILLSVYCRT